MSNGIYKVTRELLFTLFNYDPETGLFIRRVHRGRGHIGHNAGTIVDGYIRIIINEERCLAHRLAWMYVYGEWPPGEIDHINRVRSDNRIANLRVCNRLQNCNNKNLNSNNKSGASGVYFERESGKWCSQVRHQGKQIRIGRYDSKDDAIKARRDFAIQNFDTAFHNLTRTKQDNNHAK